MEKILDYSWELPLVEVNPFITTVQTVPITKILTKRDNTILYVTGGIIAIVLAGLVLYSLGKIEEEEG